MALVADRDVLSELVALIGDFRYLAFHLLGGILRISTGVGEVVRLVNRDVLGGSNRLDNLKLAQLALVSVDYLDGPALFGIQSDRSGRLVGKDVLAFLHLNGPGVSSHLCAGVRFGDGTGRTDRDLHTVHISAELGLVSVLKRLAVHDDVFGVISRVLTSRRELDRLRANVGVFTSHDGLADHQLGVGHREVVGGANHQRFVFLIHGECHAVGLGTRVGIERLDFLAVNRVSGADGPLGCDLLVRLSDCRFLPHDTLGAYGEFLDRDRVATGAQVVTDTVLNLSGRGLAGVVEVELFLVVTSVVTGEGGLVELKAGHLFGVNVGSGELEDLAFSHGLFTGCQVLTCRNERGRHVLQRIRVRVVHQLFVGGIQLSLRLSHGTHRTLRHHNLCRFLTGLYFDEVSLGLSTKRSGLSVGLAVRGFTVVGELKGSVGGKDGSALDNLLNGEARLVVFQGVLRFQLQHLSLAILLFRNGELLIASISASGVGEVRHPGRGDGDTVNLYRLFLDVAGGADQDVVNGLGFPSLDVQGAVGLSVIVTLVFKSEGGGFSLGVAVNVLGDRELAVVGLHRVGGHNLHFRLSAFLDGYHSVVSTQRLGIGVGNLAGSSRGGQVVLVNHAISTCQVGLRGPGLASLQVDGHWVVITTGDSEREGLVLQRVRTVSLDFLGQLERTHLVFVEVGRLYHDSCAVGRNLELESFSGVFQHVGCRDPGLPEGQGLKVSPSHRGAVRILGDGTGHAGLNARRNGHRSAISRDRLVLPTCVRVRALAAIAQQEVLVNGFLISIVEPGLLLQAEGRIGGLVVVDERNRIDEAILNRFHRNRVRLGGFTGSVRVRDDYVVAFRSLRLGFGNGALGADRQALDFIGPQVVIRVGRSILGKRETSTSHAVVTGVGELELATVGSSRSIRIDVAVTLD